MKKSNHLNNIELANSNSFSKPLGILKIYICLLFCLFLSNASLLFGQELDPGIALGRKIYKAQCAACHKFDRKLIGPALGGITERREKEWLKLWIKDNNALVASGDALAKEVYNSNPNVMPAYPNLTDDDLENLIKYLAAGETASKKQLTAVMPSDLEDTTSNSKVGFLPILIYSILGFILLSLTISHYSKKNKNTDEESILKAFLSSPFIRFLAIIMLLITSSWYVFGWLFQIDVNQGYQPIQPIAFSHAIHAGDNKIDCQYCHSSAKHSKISNVPSANICMNCHKSIDEYTGVPFGDYTNEELTAEIHKIYKAVGWDKDEMKYIEGYQQIPIQWTNIHNLADFAYFNHAQHVTVGGLDCKKCHGPVDEMHETYQHAPLTMNWCIDCHRDTGIDLNNDYYKNIHQKLIEKYGKESVKEIKASEMGGLECGKCHY
jgi:cytochrome c551/c552